MSTALPIRRTAHPARFTPRPAVLTSPLPRTVLPTPGLTAMAVPVRSVSVLKETLDVFIAGVLAVALLPVMLVTFALVKLTSAGPAVYSQTRVGRGGRIFTIYKFRSMYHDCEKRTGIQWSVKGDLRITPLGRWLRLLHLDELPQLWNVLCGDMSLVGPRPERPEIVADLQVSIYGYDLRHSIKPGITGFAQVHLPPDSSILTVKNKLIYDRFYIGRLGFGMDAYCLACTALKVIGLRKLYQRPPRKPAGE